MNILCTYILCISSSICFSQVDEILLDIYSEEFHLASEKLKNHLDKDTKTYCEIYKFYSYVLEGYSDTDCSNIEIKTSHEEVLNIINIANEEFYINGNSFKAYLHFKEAHLLAKDKNMVLLEKVVLKELLSVFSNNYSFQGSNAYKPFLDRFEELISSTTDESIYWLVKTRLEQRFKANVDNSIFQITKEADNHFNSVSQSGFSGRYYGYKGYNFFNKLKIPDSAIFYAQKSIDILKNKNGIHNKERYVAAHLSKGRSFLDLNLPDSAIYYLNKAPINSIDGFMKDNLMSFSHYFNWLAYEKMNQADSVKNYKLKFYEHDYVLKLDENTQNIANFDEFYKTNELTQKNEKQKYLLISLASILLLGGIIAVLINRNTKRKQRIAEQEKALEIQKTEKLLKDQEITSINAMIEGQEKERQRLASDLHDSVGATLAAAKLQFNHLVNNSDKLDEMKPLIAKTQTLLDDAYTEVRGMAHIKNSGVLAKNGLLPALKKLIKNVSATGKLEITLQDFGLDERIENTLEISIFRIIQELTTNIIKHANASKATIGITKHEDTLSIIVEDNGDGFTPSGNLNKDGMGLGSIERRIEHQDGSMEIDTTLGKGTTILIDIPI